ncbi:MAG: hypothetical protein EAX96_03670 [Candidatus Lokiarchaeota archaeon]|nr:hypothetical protein [Candidatus Lokiarchaeota archaeon]
MFDIVKSIKNEINQLTSARAYLAIIDATSEIRYMDRDLEEFKEFFINFNSTSFGILEVGDHSIPIGGQNIVFLKLSEKFILILYTKKGKIGELIPFKNKLDKFIEPINNEIGDIDLSQIRRDLIPIGESETEIEKKVLGIYPIIKQDLIEKEKFPINEARILRFCNGENSIEDIMVKSEKTRLFVNNVIKKYQKKGFLKVIRKI